MDLESFLRARGGLARTSTLQSGGFSRRLIESRRASGELIRIRRGLYGLPAAAGIFRQALSHNALITCLSAAATYALWTLAEPSVFHLSHGHRATPPEALAHGRCLHPRHPWLPVAGLADVLIHALRCLPELDALVMVQCAVGRGDVSLEFLKLKLQGNRNAPARSVLDWVIPRADSLLEVLANLHFARAGLSIRRHVQLDGVGEVDFLVEECLVVETDGGSHLEARQVKKDRKRNNAAVVGGSLVLRYSYADVVHHPQRMVAEVLEVLELRRRGVFDAK